MTTVGLIGLGAMGSGMAASLRRAGHSVQVFDVRRKVAEAFTRFLFTPTAQKLFVDNGFRPVTPEGKAYARGKFQDVKFFRISDYGGWAAFDKKFFAKGGVWDQIFSKSR